MLVRGKSNITYKAWILEKADYGYYQATDLIDCDRAMIIAKSIKQLKTEIDELHENV